MKKCSGCKVEKAVTEFNLDKQSKDGFQAYCKACHKAHHKAYREAIKAEKATVYVTSKVCLDCGLEKPRSQFGVKNNVKDKLNSYCKPCWRQRSVIALRKFNEKKKK
jgi:hypothetical protein